MTTANQQIVQNDVRAFNAGDMSALRRLFCNDALIHGVTGWGGLDAIVPIWRQRHAAFAFQLHTESLTAQGDTVVARFTERRTSIGSFPGHAATGKSSEVLAIEWFVIADGRIHRRWGARDSASHFRQMGLAVG